MCKNLILVGIKNTPKARALVRAMHGPMTERDDDGYGYAELSTRGAIHTARWVEPAHAWRVWGTSVPARGVRGHMHDSLGRPSKAVHAILAHARAATCGVSLANTHPHVRPEEGIALIHNGVIDTEGMDTSGSLGSDSRALLNAYISHGVHRDLLKMTELAPRLEGWHACGVISAEGWVDVWRSHAPLYGARIRGVGDAYCTSSELLLKACERMKLHVSGSWTLLEHHLVRLDARTGEPLDVVEYKPGPRSITWQGAGATRWDWEREVVGRVTTVRVVSTDTTCG